MTAEVINLAERRAARAKRDAEMWVDLVGVATEITDLSWIDWDAVAADLAKDCFGTRRPPSDGAT